MVTAIRDFGNCNLGNCNDARHQKLK